MATYTARSYADPELAPKPMLWGWNGYIPRLCMTEGYGEGGTMKGLSVVSVLSLFTNGDPMPDGTPSGFGRPVSIISITGEDLLSEIMSWRYRAAGANSRNIVDLSRDDDGYPFKLTREGVARIREEIARINQHEKHTPYWNMADFGGLYLDPLMSIAPVSITANVTFRSVILEPLDALCYWAKCFCFLMNHTTKDGKTVAGSAAAVQGPRMVLGFRGCKADPTKRELYRMKTNITENTPVPVRYCGEGADTSIRVRWDTEHWNALRSQRYGVTPAGPLPMGPAYATPEQPQLSVQQMFANLNT
jgi:hypothetical protein